MTFCQSTATTLELNPEAEIWVHFKWVIFSEVRVGIPTQTKNRLWQVLRLLDNNCLYLCVMQSEPRFPYNALPGTGLVGDKVFGSHLTWTMGGYRHISKQSVTNTFAQVCLQKTSTSRTPWSLSLCTNLWKPRKRSWVTQNSTWGDCTSTKQWGRQEMLGPLRQQHDKDKQNEWNRVDPWAELRHWPPHSWKSTCNYWFPSNLDTNCLLWTGSLTNNI